MEFLTQYIMGWNVAALVCLVIGLALMAFEMFTPGMGIPGILGLIALVVAVVLRADTFANAVVTLAIIFVILGVSAFFIFRSFKKGAISKSPIVLNETISEKSTSFSDNEMQSLIGLEGEALTALRPSGNAIFGERRMDVMTDGEFIQKGERIVVVNVEGLRVLVKAAK